jgi:hypothetical protein
VTKAHRLLFGEPLPREHVTLERSVEIACGEAELERAATLEESLRLVAEYAEYAQATAADLPSGEWPSVAAEFAEVAEALTDLSEQGYEQRGPWSRTSSDGWWTYFEKRTTRTALRSQGRA